MGPECRTWGVHSKVGPSKGQEQSLPGPLGTKESIPVNGHEGWCHPFLSLSTLPAYCLDMAWGGNGVGGTPGRSWCPAGWMWVPKPHVVLIPHGTSLCSTSHPLFQMSGQGDDQSGVVELGAARRLSSSPITPLRPRNVPAGAECERRGDPYLRV